MPDMEKVIKGLECCFNPHSEQSCLCHCADCPYNPPEDDDWNQQCQIELNRDALALLKEQPQVVRCKDCKHFADKDGNGFGVCMKIMHGCQSWGFCADGERRTE